MPAKASVIRTSCRRRCCELSRTDPAVSRLGGARHPKSTVQGGYAEEEKAIGYGCLSPGAPREQRIELVGKKRGEEHQEQRGRQSQPVTPRSLTTAGTAQD